MSADKLQAVHEALANVFNQSNLNATGTEASHAAFDHETLSEAFSEPHPNVANTEQSFARFDYAALTRIFSETPTERPSPTSFDQAFAEMLSERPPLSSNTQPPRPGFDHQAFAKLLTEPPPISPNTKPPQPSFDHQALAEMLTELSADPINPQMSLPSYDTDSSSAPFPGQIDNKEPVEKAFAVAPQTNAESARPPRAKSLLAKLHHIFSTKEEALLSNVEKDPLPPSLSGQLHTPEPMAKAISTPAEDALPRPADALLADLPSLGFEQEPKSPHLYGQPGNGKPVVSDVAVTSPTDAASAWPLPAASLPNEISSPISTNTESSPPTFGRKSSTPTDGGRLGNVDQGVKAVAVAAPAEAENARSQQARSLLIEPVSPSSNNIEPLPSIFGKGHWDPIPPGWLDLENVERAAKPDVEPAQRPLTELPPLISPSATPPLVLKTEPSQSVLSGQQEIVPAAAPADIESARSPAELPPLISTDIESPTPNFETEPSPPTLSGRLRNMASAASTVAPTPQTNVESARPQPGKSLLADLRPSRSFERKPSPAIFSGDLDKVGSAVETVAAATAQQHTKSSPLTDALVSADTESSFPIFQPDLPPSSLSDHPDSAVDSVGAADPTDAEGARPQHISSFLAALRALTAKPSPPILEKEASRSTLASQPANAAPTASVAAVASPTDTESAVTRAQQAKALLAELDLNTAIHLRWVMRDIRSKRTKFSPVSANDLAALMDLGLVEMREELPRLTGLGVLVLD